ncbi:MAG TPA: RHS repeat protein, partial [Gammaproteobacteria bacterium]|nr:RHS repeat protein [Gammaproteobacteria bacterium]
MNRERNLKMSITYLKSVLSRVFVIFLVFSAEAYAADFYYSWNNTPYGSLQEACDASIEYINSSGHNFSYDDVLLDECPKGDNVHCATCLARQDKSPYTATLTIASKLAAFRLGHPLDDTLQQCTVGNPIDPVTGNKIQYEPLIKIEAIQPIEFYLVYNSQRIEKWRHSYNRTLSFSASAAGKRIDFNGAPFGSKPTAESESVSLLGGKSTYPGIYYAAPDKDLTVTYPSQKAACESGWINTKKFFHYSWVPGSVAEYRPDRVNLCYILDEPAGRIKMILDIYEVLSGKKFSYGPPPDDSYLRFTRQNGRVIVFRKYPFTYNLSGTGETLEITGTGNDTLYRLTTAEDEIEVYDANGRLLSVSNRQGMTQSLVYETGTGLLSSVSSQTGESIRFAYESYGENLQYTRIKSVTDHSGRQWLFDYDPATDVLASITFPDNGQRRYHYEDPDDPQLLTGITDQSGMRYASWEYDAKGRATLSAHGQTKDKDRVELSYLGNGLRLVTKKRISGFPDGNALDIPYNYLTHVGAGKPLVAEIGGNVSLKYEYDAMTGYLDYKIENNVRTEFKNYNSSGNPGIVVEAAGTPQQRTTVYTYDSRYIDKLAVRKEPSVVPGKLKTTRYEYDDFGNNTAIITSGFRPDGTAVSRVTTFEYNGPFHQLTKIDGPRTDVSDIYTIDYYPDDAAQGSNRARMKRVTAPLNITLYDSITYTSTGNIQSYTDANGVQTTLSYYYGNDRLQTLSQLDINTGVQRITEWTYLATGEVKTITTGSDIADKTTLTLNYDDARRLTSIVDGLGNAIEYILDSEGNVEQENIKDNTGALKKQLTQIFDDYNRLQLRTQVNESYTETWSPDGTLAMTVDGKNVTTDYSYDNLRRLAQINQDMGGTSPQTANAITILNYDIQDNLTYVKNPVNGETTYTYDDLGNQLTRSSDDTGLTVYEYDDAGNIISMIDANGETTLYTYDALNRLTSITTSSPDDSYQLAYDNCNNGAGRLCMVSGLTSTQYYSYNAFGDIISQQGLQYSYDTAGRLKTITYPSLAVVRYDYDAAGQVQQVSLERNGSMVPLASDITYDPFGDINALLYGNALTLSQSRDAAYRPLSQEILGVFNLNYVNYDANGNLLQRNDGISNQSSL